MESVQLFEDEKKGRGLKANKDLAAGEVVFAEPSFAAAVFSSLSTDVCHSCFRHKANLHRCGQCKFAHYCDRTCQTACWDEHKQECGAIKKYGKAPNENVRLAARVLWRIQKDSGIMLDGQLTSVDQLQDHLADLSEDALKDLNVDVQTFLKYWPSSKQPSEESVAHILGIITCNAFTMSDQRGLQAVGVGLFPNLCLVNHDCWPNCTVILNHGKQSALNSALHSKRRIELRSLGKIAEGTELTVGYVDFLNLAADRQRALKQQYHFDCACDHCTNHTKDDLMQAACETDGKKPAADLVKEVTDFTKTCLEKIEESRSVGDYDEVVKLCHECLGKQANVLADTHLYRMRLMSVASEVLSFQKKFLEAADLAHKMLRAYRELYHPNNAQLGMATMRAGLTRWHAGQIEAGHTLICKAYGILLVTHGPNHSIVRDLEGMRTQTEIELKMFKQNAAAYNTIREEALSLSAESADQEAKDLRQQ